jgi:hypothetical protein
MSKTFKGFPICEKHGITYHWKDRCCRICRKEKRPMKKLDAVLKQMEDDGLIPKVKNNDKNDNNSN